MNAKLQTTIVLMAFLTLIIVISGCGPQQVTLDAAHNGGQVSVRDNGLIVIRLPANPSTGYTWEPQDLDSGLFAQTGEPVFTSDNPDLLGSGGIQVLTFRALRPGTATLTLVHHRPWETDVAPLETFTVTVTVK
ncbi:MAG: protease inhibitor I42 family protein [Anaerolineales bacterium]|nr:protease inhibitor I42 family protein [Anaerolineales bacterium]